MYTGQRIVILRLLQILQRDSDESNPLTTGEILSKLKSVYDVRLERKTLYEYMDLLCDAGYDIVKIRAKSNRYFLGSREFELPEIKILIDAVLASRFIPKKQSKQLVDKLAGFAGKHKEKLLKRDVFLADLKHNNYNVLYIVDTVFEAIHNGKKISFLYYDYILEKQKVLHRKERYLADPVKLVYCNENYYLAAYLSQSDTIKNFRVDKMDAVQEEPLPKTDCTAVKRFDVKAYLSQTFCMYGGETETVEMLVEKEILKSAIDRFGPHLNYAYNKDGAYQFFVKVKISPTFFSWCAAFGEKLKIAAPDHVRQDYKEFLQKALITC
ncbi:MAG: WYL domain-containing protein [Clostridia bacterium]|nr:WYL domain-containing protein [Clostridia bacterium]